MATLFRLFVVNCTLGNGDAHLKNFGMLYDGVRGDMVLSPAYDILTSVYLPRDAMALTLGGTTRWPERKRLVELGTVRCGLSPTAVGEVIETVAGAVEQVSADIQDYAQDHPEFAEIGKLILTQWGSGFREALGIERILQVRSPAEELESLPGP